MYKYPLLLKGSRLPSVAAGAVLNFSGTLVSGRGSCIKLDLVNSSQALLNQTFNTIQVGGQNVLQDASAGLFKWNSLPVQRVQLVGKFGENQSFQVLTANGSAVALQSNFLEYYENPYDKPGVVDLLNNNVLATKQVSFSGTWTPGLDRTDTYVVPKNRGRIFAVQPYIDKDQAANPAGWELPQLTVSVNGVNIMETVTALTFTPDSTRQNFFPIDIEPGSTIQLRVNNTGGGATIFASLILFFTPDANC